MNTPRSLRHGCGTKHCTIASVSAAPCFCTDRVRQKHKMSTCATCGTNFGTSGSSGSPAPHCTANSEGEGEGGGGKEVSRSTRPYIESMSSAGDDMHNIFAHGSRGGVQSQTTSRPPSRCRCNYCASAPAFHVAVGRKTPILTIVSAASRSEKSLVLFARTRPRHVLAEAEILLRLMSNSMMEPVECLKDCMYVHIAL